MQEVWGMREERRVPVERGQRGVPEAWEVPGAWGERGARHLGQQIPEPAQWISLGLGVHGIWGYGMYEVGMHRAAPCCVPQAQGIPEQQKPGQLAGPGVRVKVS